MGKFKFKFKSNLQVIFSASAVLLPGLLLSVLLLLKPVAALLPDELWSVTHMVLFVSN